MDETNICPICGGNLERKAVTVDETWKDYHVKIENVQADVCDTCGERYFDYETAKHLQDIAIRGSLQVS